MGLILDEVFKEIGQYMSAEVKKSPNAVTSSVKSKVAMFCVYMKRVNFDLNSVSGHKNPNVSYCT